MAARDDGWYWIIQMIDDRVAMEWEAAHWDRERGVWWINNQEASQKEDPQIIGPRIDPPDHPAPHKLKRNWGKS